MEEQVKKNQCIDIHMYEYAYEYDPEVQVTTYENIVGHQLGNNWLAIFTQTGETHIKPVKHIKFIRVYNKE